jgi:hypothetical protein
MTPTELREMIRLRAAVRMIRRMVEWGDSPERILHILDLAQAAHSDAPLPCDNCGKTMAEHDALAHCWGPESKTFAPAHIDGSECGKVQES